MPQNILIFYPLQLNFKNTSPSKIVFQNSPTLSPTRNVYLQWILYAHFGVNFFAKTSTKITAENSGTYHIVYYEGLTMFSQFF